MPLYFATQYFTTTLNVGGGIDASQTTGIIAQSITGVDYTKPGIACITYSDPIVTSTAEWITYTSINNSTKEFNGVTRGAEGFSAHTHANGATIAFPLSRSHINELANMFTTGGDGYTQIATPSNPASGYNKLYFKDDDILYILNSAGTEASFPTAASTTTFTNKRTDPRIVSAASYTTDTGTSLNFANCDMFIVTAQAGALKFNNPGGTPVQGNKLIIRIKDDGTARALTYDTQFRALGVALPTTTILSKTLYMDYVFNSTDTKWDLVKVAQEDAVTTGLSSKVITATRDMTAASGDMSYTGVGFIPTSIQAHYTIETTTYGGRGFTDSSKTSSNLRSDGSAVLAINSNLICSSSAAGGFQEAIVKTFDSDGFTLTWTKTSSPTGTLKITFLCFK